MSNRTTRDLDDPTIRARFYNGITADALAEEMPLLPVDAPGLPPPGPSFVGMAILCGDEGLEAPGVKRKQGVNARRPDGPHLTRLVRSALYQPGTTLRAAYNGHADTYELTPGLAYHPAGSWPGPSPCRLMVVGKCVGRVEATTGRPFTGPGSRPLWEAWKEAGLPARGSGPAWEVTGTVLPTFLTNLIRFELPGPVQAAANLPADWVADGVHLLYQEFAVCRPELVLVFGADALRALLGKKARIADYCGRTAEFTVDCRPTADSPEDPHTAMLVVADHPAAVARDPGMVPAFVSGIKYAAARLGFGTRVTAAAALDHQAVLTLDELRAEVRRTERASAGGGYVSFDCEWEGRHPTEPGSYLYTVQWSHAPGHARSAFLRRCGGEPNHLLPVDQAAPLLRRLLADAPKRGARLVGHFAKADLPWLESVGVDCYEAFAGTADDPDPDGVDRLWASQKSYFDGAFDTYVAAHAHTEDLGKGSYKLELLAASLVGVERYDVALMEWKEKWVKDNGKLAGYGNAPEHIIRSYGAWDVDATGRLYLYFNGDPREGTRGALDADRFGNSCRQIFATRMRAWAAVAEMERYGLGIDVHEQARLRTILSDRRDELLGQLRDYLGWHDVWAAPPGVRLLKDGTPAKRQPARKLVNQAFDPAKRLHRVAVLFGEEYLPEKYRENRVVPPGAMTLDLGPFKSTDKTGGRLWAEALARATPELTPEPATDKETIAALVARNAEHRGPLGLLRDIDTLATAAKIVFRAPDEPTDGDGVVAVEDEEHSRGLLAGLNADGRIRSTFGWVETGRLSSGGGVNLQNITSTIDEQYNRILGWGPTPENEGKPEYDLHFGSRSIFVSRPGWKFVAADLKGAEIATAGWNSGDPTLIEDAARANLPKGDPRFLDLHADLANAAFNLGLTMAEVKKTFPHLRTAAKRARFGHYYGASPETILRKAQEDDPNVTLEQVQEIVIGHDKKYPVLAGFFAACRARVANPGWMCNGFGGYRRCRPAVDRDLKAAQEREFQNWSCQGLVADAISSALGHTWFELRRLGLRSRIVLSVHDSIMIEAPDDEVPVVHDEVLPRCMSELVAVVPTDLDGRPITTRGPYHFGVDIKVFRRWDVDVPEAEWRADAARARDESSGNFDPESCLVAGRG